jgi:hypothetical protein
MLGRSKGAAIKLDAHEEVTLGLHIGEGIETTMAGREFGFAPAWAVGSSGGVADFPVIAGLEALTRSMTTTTLARRQLRRCESVTKTPAARCISASLNTAT